MADVEIPARNIINTRRRKVSAIRHWPKGCGRIAASSTSRPPSDSSVASLPPDPSNPAGGFDVFVSIEPPLPKPSTIQLETLLDPPKCDDAGALPDAPRMETMSGSAEAEKIVECAADHRKRSPEGCASPAEDGEITEPEKVALSRCEFLAGELNADGEAGAAAEEGRYLKLYRPPLKRRVRAIRDFPRGCGRNASGSGEGNVRSRHGKGEPGRDGKNVGGYGNGDGDPAASTSYGNGDRKNVGGDGNGDGGYVVVTRKPSSPGGKPIVLKLKRPSGVAIKKSEDLDAQNDSGVRERFHEIKGTPAATAPPNSESFGTANGVRFASEGDEYLEVAVDKLVVQGLAGSQNCPWRQQSKTPGDASAIPKLPNSSTKKRGRPPKSHSFKAPSNPQPANGVTGYEEDASPRYGTDGALVVHRGKQQQVDVTLAPCLPSVTNLNGGETDEAGCRNRVKRALRIFQAVLRRVVQKAASGEVKITRIDLEASNILKRNNEYLYQGKKIVGSVPGVEVGDEFHYRVELSVVGLHGPFQGGIDTVDLDHGLKIATSIVSSGGYPDDMEGSDVLVYSGAGGTPQFNKEGSDQRLERGNLALKNSIDEKNPVRVIYGFKERAIDPYNAKGKLVSTFTYDGLYFVERYWQELGPHGFNVFKFQLRRQSGQPETGKKQVNQQSKKSGVREGIVLPDISMGKEPFPIHVVNTTDGELPDDFRYTTEIVYPPAHLKTPPRGCNCINGCSDSLKCACAMKNGGELPFNFNGAIMRARQLVYECGPACKCPPSCQNRVSQHGIRIPLEIFKTKSKGWGVRSLHSIASGSFICEYAGEMIHDEEAEKRNNDEYLFDIGHNYDDADIWEGLPALIPEFQCGPIVESDGDSGFTIDAAACGNVGRFINHSCSPNLYAQNVLYDNNDRKMPHIMLFAAENIPPLRELTYHYNYKIDEVRSLEGNVKRKNCYCGALGCIGRLY